MKRLLWVLQSPFTPSYQADFTQFVIHACLSKHLSGQGIAKSPPMLGVVNKTQSSYWTEERPLNDGNVTTPPAPDWGIYLTLLQSWTVQTAQCYGVA